MKVRILLTYLGIFLLTNLYGQSNNRQNFEGFFNFSWEESTGKIWLEIDKLDQEFLYVNSLAAGVGSNDIGLDRGQLGNERVVKFVKSGPKILMVQPNYRYRAVSDNEQERRAVEEAFAQSVLWGFKVAEEKNGKYIVDATDFLMRDAHGVIGSLSGQGNYRLEASRSAIYLPRTKSFPKNTEFEATLTFMGKATGGYIRSVTPTPDAVTVRQHHSFVELPDNDYEPRVFNPNSGYFGTSFYDYATPIGEPLKKHYINRHRLKKKNPKAKRSEAVEPIVYYLDPGTPEPVRSALLDGARWWNQAFEAAGYKDAFQVKMLPKDADPLDVRYNVIQWVHRSTRGWSYGASVVDPRTGEIIKGHVSLGSLRVRQDYLIAQGLLSPFENGKKADPRMLELALARLRQLSAHEVGHTIGLSHNFAASVNNRASVMDYPHPMVLMNENTGELDFSKVYDDKIGAWDKRTILYGYQDFPKGTNEATALQTILKENLRLGLKYITDQDARPQGGAHAHAHLWDNGKNAVEELNRVLKVRAKALEKFGKNSIPEGAPMAMLEDVLVPLYLAHRYQTEAAVKLVGGLDYTYAMKGDGQTPVKFIPKAEQEAALKALLQTIDPATLAIPKRIVAMIPPRPQGFSSGREHFKSKTGLAFDPLVAAESAANHTIKLLLHPDRVSRMISNHALDANNPDLLDVIGKLLEVTWQSSWKDPYEQEVARVVQLLVMRQLMQLAVNPNVSGQARGMALLGLRNIYKEVDRNNDGLSTDKAAHYIMAAMEIKQFLENPNTVKIPKAVPMPDGSPIGCGE